MDRLDERVRTRLEQIRRELQPIVKKLGQAHGLQLTVGSGSYTLGGKLTIRIEGVLEGATTEAVRRYLDNRHRWGLPVIGSSYRYCGESWRILGMTPTHRVQVERLDGLRISLTPEVLRQRLGLDKLEASRRDAYLGALAREYEEEGATT